MVRNFLNHLFGLDPILLDIDKRTKKMEATVNSENEWLLICKPTNTIDSEIIKCSDRNIYIKSEKK